MRLNPARLNASQIGDEKVGASYAAAPSLRAGACLTENADEFDSLSDIELAAAAQDDSAAFEWMVRKHYRVLAYRLTPFCRPGEVDDLMQQTWIRVWRNLNKFNGPSLRAWIMRIGLNVGIDAMRAASRRSESALPADHAAPPVSHDTRLLVWDLLARLDPAHAQLLVMKEIWGWSLTEVARALGRPEGTIKSALFRARESAVRYMGVTVLHKNRNRL